MRIMTKLCVAALIGAPVSSATAQTGDPYPNDDRTYPNDDRAYPENRGYPEQRPYPDNGAYPNTATYPEDRRYPGGYTGRLTCESRNGRRQVCAAPTDGYAVVLRNLSRTQCVQGRNWSVDRRAIVVDDGCRAEFGYGRAYAGGGSYPGYPQPDRNRGPSTGAVIAGVAVAGGLIALLASQANKKKAATEAAAAPPPASGSGSVPGTSFRPGPPAAIAADLRELPAAARGPAQTCMFEAARQIGATGGTRVAWDKMTSLEPGNGGYRFRADLTADYPDGQRQVPMFCRATPSRVIQLDFVR